jgi:2-keto-4-pentenoate hydratase/2-oxohepta-3-ene-1,7-dioic acid hydratase in catechol pathway
MSSSTVPAEIGSEMAKEEPMKVVVFGVQRRVGLWEEDTVVDVNNAAVAYLSSRMPEDRAELRASFLAPSDLASFIGAGEEGLELTREAARYVKGSSDGSIVQPMSSVRLRAPWAGKRIFCAGANYGQHVADGLTNYGKPTTRESFEKQARQEDPWGFMKTPVEVMGPGDNIIYPSRLTQFDYEAEIAVVIGEGGRDIPASDARRHIYGLTLANDLSDRNGPMYGKYSVSFNLVKNFDYSLALGPCILVDGSDPQDIDVRLEINGQVRQDYNSEDMIFSFAEYIEYLSHYMALAPGDIIMGGTNTGTAADQSKRHPDGEPVDLALFLKVGDVVSITSSKIGGLSNSVVSQ